MLILTMAQQPGDRVLMLDLNYGSQMKILAHHGISPGSVTRLEAPLQLGDSDASDEVPFELRVDAAQLVKAVKEELASNKSSAQYRLAIFDHVTSNTAAVLPVAELVTVCRNAGEWVVLGYPKSKHRSNLKVKSNLSFLSRRGMPH
jgi:hypothetical protein